jgi:YVTN family beta-propeller protein
VHRPNARPRSPAGRILTGADLSWARRLVALVTVVGLVAVACSSGGDDGDSAQTGTGATGDPTTTSGASTTTGKKIDVLPGMPAVTNPSNLYSDTGSKDMSAAVQGALTRVYVPNRQDNTVSVIDPATMQVIDTFPVGVNPQHIVPSWDLETLYTTDTAEGRTDGSLTAIDPLTGRPGQRFMVDDPYNMYFTPDGKTGLVVAEARKRLDFYDPHTWQLQGSLDVPECSGVNHADFSIDGKFAIFTCEFQGSLVKVDIQNRAVLGYLTLSGGGMPQDIRVSPDGGTFYVAEMMRGGVYTVDPYAFTETGFIDTGVGAHGLYPSRDATKLYVANRGHDHVGGNAPDGPGSISVIDFATKQVIVNWPIPDGGSPDMGGVSVDGLTLWLAGRYDDEVYAINTLDGRVTKIPVGNEPHGLAVWPQPGRYSLGHTSNLR